MAGTHFFAAKNKWIFSLFFRMSAILITVTVICRPTLSSAIESLSEMESRGVTAEGALAVDEGFLTTTLANAAESEASRKECKSSDEISEAQLNSALALFFPLAGLTRDNVRDILSRAQIRAGQCDLLTAIGQKGAVTGKIVTGFTFILPEYEIKTPQQKRELMVNVPDSDNAGQSMGQIRQTGGRIHLQGGTVEISGSLPQPLLQSP